MNNVLIIITFASEVFPLISIVEEPFGTFLTGVTLVATVTRTLSATVLLFGPLKVMMSSIIDHEFVM